MTTGTDLIVRKPKSKDERVEEGINNALDLHDGYHSGSHTLRMKLLSGMYAIVCHLEGCEDQLGARYKEKTKKKPTRATTISHMLGYLARDNSKSNSLTKEVSGDAAVLNYARKQVVSPADFEAWYEKEGGYEAIRAKQAKRKNSTSGVKRVMGLIKKASKRQKLIYLPELDGLKPEQFGFVLVVAGEDKGRYKWTKSFGDQKLVTKIDAVITAHYEGKTSFLKQAKAGL